MNLNLFRKIFSYSRKEKNGILVLIVLIIVLSAFNLSAPLLVDNQDVDFSEWQAEIDSFYASPLKLSEKDQGIILQDTLGNVKKKGQSEKINYGNADSARSGYKGKYFPRKTPDTVELNSADSAKLESLPGLGPVLSGRIIKYRRMLGGFYSLEQLNEVYGLKEEFLSKALPYIALDPSGIKKLRINFLSKDELARHPYITYSYARSIVKMRSDTGKIEVIEEISVIIPDKELKKIEPYLSFD